MALFSAIIPSFHKEFTAAADRAIMGADKPTNANKVVGIRINDVTSGTTIVLRMSGTEVAYDNCAVGEVISGCFDKIESTSSTVDSVIVYYV
jgi:hypothetical protein